MKTEVKETRMQNEINPDPFPHGAAGTIKTVQAALIMLPVIIFILLGIHIINLSAHQAGSDVSGDGGSYFWAFGTNNDDLPSMQEHALAPVVKEKVVSMTAYTSRVKETDSTPCISADGTNICKYDGCVVASNDYPFDTVVNIEGVGECIVKDRMSSRFTGKSSMDLYFGHDLEGAMEFGRKKMKVTIASS